MLQPTTRQLALISLASCQVGWLTGSSAGLNANALVRARWQEPEGPHAVENTDSVADRFICVELKQ